MMRPYHSPPFDSPVASDSPRATLSALEKAIAAATSEAKQAEVTLVAPACDGHPIVYVGDGTACHEAASPSAGGQPALGVDLGGTTIRVEADLGRTLSPVVGYHGATPSLGGLPSTMDPGAADLGIAPEESAVTAAVEETRDDPGVEFVGATISGLTGDSKRCMVCEGTNGAEYYDNLVSGTPAAVSGLSNNPDHVGCIGPDTYALCQANPPSLTVSLATGAAETGTTALPTDSGYLKGPLTAMAMRRDGKIAAIVGYNNTPPSAPDSYHRLYIGTDMDTTPAWGYADIGTRNVEVYNTRCLAWGASYLYVVCETGIMSGSRRVVRLASPYTTVDVTCTPSAPTTTGYAIAVSRDEKWLAYGYASSGSALVDLWRAPASGTPAQTLTLSGYTAKAGYGGIQFGPDGKLFCIVRKTADSTDYLAVWSPQASGNLYDTAAEIIALPQAPGGLGWLSVSADGLCCAIAGRGSSGADIITVEAPFTAGDATTGVVTASNPVRYQLEFDAEVAYADASGLTLTAGAQSMTPSGDAVQTVTRLSWSASSAVFALKITCPVPDGVTFVSATNGGTYDSTTRVVTWFLGTKTGGSSGYVELTTEVS